jgi:hypothetical protein
MDEHNDVVFAWHVGIWLRSKGKHRGNLFIREEMMCLYLLELVFLIVFDELIMVINVGACRTGTTLLDCIKPIDLDERSMGSSST